MDTFRDWERVQHIGLFPKITNVQQYEAAVHKGVLQAKEYLKKYEIKIPTLEEIKDIHVMAFGRVHPWAGTFRGPGQSVQVGDTVCTAPADIEKELTYLHKEMTRAPFKGSAQYTAEVIAYYHSAFEAIHPFLDGNGRTGRLILENQLELGLGIDSFQTLTRTPYIRALKESHRSGDLKPLSSLLLGLKRSKSSAGDWAVPGRKL